MTREEESYEANSKAYFIISIVAAHVGFNDDGLRISS